MHGTRPKFSEMSSEVVPIKLLQVSMGWFRGIGRLLCVQ